MEMDNGASASRPGSSSLRSPEPQSVSAHAGNDPSRGRLLLKPFRVEVRGFPDFTYYAPTRGKALAKAWGLYSNYDDSCRFGDFLKIAKAYGAVGSPQFGDPIIVAGKPAFFVSNDPPYVQFVRPDCDVIMNSHPYDVLPVEYRPSTYRDRDSDEHPKGEDAERLSGEAMPARAEGIAHNEDDPS